MAAASARLSTVVQANTYPLAVASAIFAIAVAIPAHDADAYWQLATGRWMPAHGELLRQDVFSSTVAGAHLFTGEWLGQLAFAAAFTSGGWVGAVALRALLVATGAFFMVRLARRGGVSWLISLPVALIALAVSTTAWVDRPLTFTIAFVPLLLDLLFAAPTGFSLRLALVPPLFALWANLHEGYLLGLFIVAVFAAHALLVDGRRGIALAITTIVAGAASLINPSPLEIGAALDALLRGPRFLDEFRPADVLKGAGVPFAAMLLLVLASALLRGGGPRDAMLLLPLLYLAFTAQRQMTFFAIAAVPFVAPRLDSLQPFGHLPELPRALRLPLALGLAVVALGSLPLAASVDERSFPAGALAVVRGDRGVLLNEYEWGGYLILDLPERPVFIDGRYAPYVPAVFDDYHAMVGLRSGWKDLLAKYRVDELLLRPSRPLAVALREEGWRVRAEEPEQWVVLSRP